MLPKGFRKPKEMASVPSGPPSFSPGEPAVQQHSQDAEDVAIPPMKRTAYSCHMCGSSMLAGALSKVEVAEKVCDGCLNKGTMRRIITEPQRDGLELVEFLDMSDLSVDSYQDRERITAWLDSAQSVQLCGWVIAEDQQHLFLETHLQSGSEPAYRYVKRIRKELLVSRTPLARME